MNNYPGLSRTEGFHRMQTFSAKAGAILDKLIQLITSEVGGQVLKDNLYPAEEFDLCPIKNKMTDTGT